LEFITSAASVVAWLVWRWPRLESDWQSVKALLPAALSNALARQPKPRKDPRHLLLSQWLSWESLTLSWPGGFALVLSLRQPLRRLIAAAATPDHHHRLR